MSEKDAILRQRLIELEKKHAKALRKLQRAERSKQRHQTFHGFPVCDENTGRLQATPETSNILQCQQRAKSCDVRKPSCFSAHKKGHGKTVTFMDAAAQDKTCNESIASHSSGSKKTPKKRPAPAGSFIPQGKSLFYAATLQCDVESENMNLGLPNGNVVELGSHSLVLADNEKFSDDNIVITEKHDNYPDHSQEFEDLGKENFPVSKDMSKLPACNQEINNLELEERLAKSSIDYETKKVQNAIKETVSVHQPAADQNSQHITEESMVLLRGSVTLNQADGFQSGETDNSPSASKNWHWLQLFEEEFPRRSPRLRSTPNFGSQAVDSQGNNAAQSRKSKPTKTRQSRSKKVKSQSSGCKMSAFDTGNAMLHDSLSEERTEDVFVFPKHSLEHSKTGGPLSVVVDFSLPDAEFAKLKLAKIRNALSAEKENKEINDKAEGMIREYVQEIEGRSQLPESKWTNIEGRDSVEGAVEQNSFEEEWHTKLPSSKCRQEATSIEECSGLLNQVSSSLQGCIMELKTEVTSEQVDRLFLLKSLRENKTEAEKELSPVNFESKKQLEYGSFSLEHEQHDLQLQNLIAQNNKASISLNQKSCEGAVDQTCTVCQCRSGHCNCHKFQVDFDSTLAQDSPKTDDKGKGGLTLNSELYNSFCEVNRHIGQRGLTNENDCVINSTLETADECEVPNQNKCTCSDQSSKIAAIHETCSSTVTFDSPVKAVPGSPKILNEQGEVFNYTQGNSSPVNPEPTSGDQATPHGKMNEPLESSEVSCVMLPENHTERSPVQMVACLQHHIDRQDNRVRSVSLSSYEPSSEKDASSLLQKRRDVVHVAVCLAHLVVIWVMVPESQWSVLYKWSLPLDGEEEFFSVHFIPIKSHVVLLVGGNFYKGNGRILGYSSEGDYSLDLCGDDESKKPLFSTMCLLHETLEQKVDKDVEFIIGSRTSDKVTLTKWSLDSFCLLVEGSQTFTPVYIDTELSSLQPVCGSHCLVLGTTDDTLFLWNHKTCQQLRSINLDTMGLGGLFCLKAIMQRGFVFLMMAGNSVEKRNSVDTNAAVCSLYALNPKSSKMVSLECFCLPERVDIVSTNGQYIAAGGQRNGEVNIWNITNSQSHANLQVFQDELSSIGFHPDKPLMAFGSSIGCVHLLTWH